MEEAEFIIQHGEGLYSNFNRDELDREIKRHKEYGTILVLKKDNEIQGICRWNIDTPEIFYIIDVVVRNDLSRQGLLKTMILWGKKHFPHFKYIRYERGKKNKKMRLVNINKIIKE